MKFIALLLCALSLCSCGASKPIITLELQNHSSAEWILVSVRDSSVVLLPPFEEIGKGIAFTHCILIPRKDIWRIVLHPQFTFLSRLPMSLFGAGTGAALKACSCNDRFYHITVGFAAGWMIGGLLFFLENMKDDSYYLWLESDRIRLRKNAVYPIEPEIMKYIR